MISFRFLRSFYYNIMVHCFLSLLNDIYVVITYSPFFTPHLKTYNRGRSYYSSKYSSTIKYLVVALTIIIAL